MAYDETPIEAKSVDDWRDKGGFDPIIRLNEQKGAVVFRIMAEKPESHSSKYGRRQWWWKVREYQNTPNGWVGHDAILSVGSRQILRSLTKVEGKGLAGRVFSLSWEGLGIGRAYVLVEIEDTMPDRANY